MTSFATRPPWLPLDETNLKWALIEGNGPFITNGQNSRPQFEASNSGTESDTFAIMFNLDSLNEGRLEIVQAQTWMTGCIPESPDSFIKSLVQRVNHKRFRFELGDSSNRPRLIAPQLEAAQPNADKKTPPKEQSLRLLNILSQLGQHANPQET